MLSTPPNTALSDIPPWVFTAGTPAPDMPSISTPINRLNIPSTRGEAAEDYCAWQQLQVKKPTLKAEYRNACNVIIEDGT